MSDIDSVPLWLLITIAILALLGASFTTLVAAALTRITRSQAEDAEDEGKSRYLVSIVERRPAASTATNIVYTAFVVVFAALLAAIFARFVDTTWGVLGLVLLAALILIPLMRVFIPSSLGYKQPVKILSLVGGVLAFLTRLAAIFVRHREVTDETEKEAEDESQLQAMVERVAESNAIEESERSLLVSVFELSSTLVREVMVPRTDMITINSGQPLDKAVSLFVRSGYSRVPVIGDSVDDLLGVIYLKDVIRRTHRRSDTEGLTVDDVMRDPVFVPETLTVDVLLHKMQTESIHIALVVDEYGGIAGLVTIEDLLEELVGEMVDEHDRALPEVEDLGDGSYRLPARMSIDDVAELFDVKLDDDDVDTIGGLLTKSLGRVPITGTEATVQGLELKADRFEGRRKRLAWVVARKAEDEEDSNG